MSSLDSFFCGERNPEYENKPLCLSDQEDIMNFSVHENCHSILKFQERRAAQEIIGLVVDVS
jgi:hypothetical protein